MANPLQEMAELLVARRDDAVLNTSISHGELTVTIVPARLVSFLEFLKQDNATHFSQLVDITAVDYPEREKRFEVVYHLLSLVQNQRIRVKAELPVDIAIASVMSVYPSANWYEREVFDMYGIVFTGHPDLRRLLTDYGFRGHPLRKDFPTTGYVELRYDEVEKRVVYEPVTLVQEYRQFDFMSPWEGAEYILPEKEGAK
ncbi:NADH-quinone oxidoreductase subunit C [Abyssibius alkaniclasticus]|uniref:NADH-quinone oxidoreductase subunit C n=1 Tax=Abyssibius alkaniclasticus TaxID=2881234 RepID=UPI00405A10B2|tara:strand:- start:1353 stop:1952 length:600 start_codon:yes stop_codon:yes gene_type:complete